jgi:peroxiredoxin
MVFVLMVIFLLTNAWIVAAQFFEAGVQKPESPIVAPDFTLNKLGGGKVSLKDLRGKIILLNFFVPWCEVCRKESSSFEKMAEEYKVKDLVFFLVAAKAKEKDLREFKKEFHISLPILMDKSGSVAKAYKVFGHHETFFINRQGKIVGKSFGIGIWTSPNMKKLLEYLLAEDK